jgi:hypothetical protein
MSFEFPIPTGLQDALTGGAKQAKEYVDATAERVLARLDEIKDAIDAGDTRENTVWRVFSGTVGADGTVNVELGGPRLGFIWTVNRATVIAGGGSAEFFLGGPTNVGLVHRIVDATRFTGDVGAGGISVTNAGLVVRIEGAPANGQVLVRVQAIEQQATPLDER